MIWTSKRIQDVWRQSTVSSTIDTLYFYLPICNYSCRLSLVWFSLRMAWPPETERWFIFSAQVLRQVITCISLFPIIFVSGSHPSADIVYQLYYVKITLKYVYDYGSENGLLCTPSLLLYYSSVNSAPWRLTKGSLL